MATCCSSLQNALQAMWRARADDRQAALLRQVGMPGFLQLWYAQPLWQSLRRNPQLPRLLERRQAAATGSQQALATVLQAMSTGRMVGH